MNFCDNNIKEARLAKGVGQKVLANELGVSCPTISDWENKKKYPAVENLKQLCAYFGASADYLLALSNSPSVSQHHSPHDFTPAELNMIQLFRSASDDDKATVEFILSKYKKAQSAM